MVAPALDTSATPPLPSGYLAIGDFELGVGTSARCVLIIKPKAKGKVQKTQASGKDDAKTTWQGKEPADLEISLAWDERGDDDAICEILYQIGPRGPNPGKTYKVAFRDQRIHGVDTLIVEDLEGPDRTPETSKVTAKLKASSISPQAQKAGPGQGAAKTDTDPQKAGSGQTTVVHGFGGDPNNTVTFPGNVPTVKP